MLDCDVSFALVSSNPFQMDDVDLLFPETFNVESASTDTR